MRLALSITFFKLQKLNSNWSTFARSNKRSVVRQKRNKSILQPIISLFFFSFLTTDLLAPIKPKTLNYLSQQLPHLPPYNAALLASVGKDQTCVWWWLPKELQLMACHLSLELQKGGTPGSMMQTKARFRTSILKAPIDSLFLRPASEALVPAGSEPRRLSWEIRGICRN